MNKFEETINEMKQDIIDLEEDYKAKADKFVDEETKAKAQELVEKTKTAINNSIDKVTAVINDLKEDEKVDELLDKVKAKSLEAVDYTKNKIDQIANNTNDKTLQQLHDEIMAEFDVLKESDTIKKTTVLLKEVDTKINDFLEKPEVKSAINKAKTTTINVAEKGVEELKKVLKVDEIEASKQEENK